MSAAAVQRSAKRIWPWVVLAVLAAVLAAAAGPRPGLATTCDPATVGVIGCENQLPGSPPSEWDIGPNGADKTIEGFADRISVDHGGTIGFKVKTDATAYRIEIYRVGWYGGDGARRVAIVQPSATLPQTQPACLTTTPRGSSTAATGHGRRRGTSGGRRLGALPRDPQTDRHGRRERDPVRGARRRAATRTCSSRRPTRRGRHTTSGAATVSTRGPACRGPRVQGQLQPPVLDARDANPSYPHFDAEYPMIRWLERNGYDVSYTSASTPTVRPSSEPQGLHVGRP